MDQAKKPAVFLCKTNLISPRWTDSSMQWFLLFDLVYIWDQEIVSQVCKLVVYFTEMSSDRLLTMFNTEREINVKESYVN